jgi:hypothetical protein
MGLPQSLLFQESCQETEGIKKAALKSRKPSIACIASVKAKNIY